MRLGLLCFAAVMMAALPACASDKTKVVKLTVIQALNLKCAINADKDQSRQPMCPNLESADYIIKEGDRERVVPKRYTYKPGVISAMAKNILALQYVTDAFNKERALLQEKIITILVAPDQKEQKAEFDRWVQQQAEYTKAANALGEAPHDFNLFTFSDVELGIAESVPEKDRNQFPASLLAAINPIRE